MKRLGNKIYRGIERLPLVRYQTIKIWNFLISVIFKINYKSNKNNYEILNKCSTLGEYFHFSMDMFETLQIEKEITDLIVFLKNHNPTSCCEIGTATGGTNFLLSQAIPSVKKIIGVDLNMKNKHKLSYYNPKKVEQHFIRGYSQSIRTFEKVNNCLNGRQLDVLFIDGDHRYNGVKKDFELYSSLMKKGGFIVFHDIIPDFMTKHGIKTNRFTGGVPHLWKELKNKYTTFEFVENYEQDGLGIGALEWK